MGSSHYFALLFLIIRLFQEVVGGVSGPPYPVRQLKPSYTLQPADGITTSVECQFTGFPLPEVTWARNGKRLPSEPVFSGPYYYSNGTLVLENTLPADSGNYSCTGTNTVGAVTLSTQITIIAPNAPSIWLSWWMILIYLVLVWLFCSSFICVYMFYCAERVRNVSPGKEEHELQYGYYGGAEDEQTTSEAPLGWSECTKCASDALSNKRYHLIELPQGSEEWTRVTAAFTEKCSYHVTKIQRIQNIHLWSRYQSEKKHVVRGRPEGYDVNERLLYHTSSAEKAEICDEGLDQRLSRSGLFGRGIYFSDNPKKCNSYWKGGSPRLMFACLVLLGDAKVLPIGQTHNSLCREPKRTLRRQGQPAYYDSVQGARKAGENEYIVYLNNKAYPSYAIEYTP